MIIVVPSAETEKKKHHQQQEVLEKKQVEERRGRSTELRGAARPPGWVWGLGEGLGAGGWAVRCARRVRALV